MDPDGVLAEALEVVEIAEAAVAGEGVFTAGELGYARSKPDPTRRLAARLAAKRAAARILGEGLSLREVEVVAGRGGPPRLRLGPDAEARRAALGGRFLLSLTHGETHAAAAVLLVLET
jgi:phosphopantetheinyl transferase (holo-ACP synthase)